MYSLNESLFLPVFISTQKSLSVNIVLKQSIKLSTLFELTLIFRWCHDTKIYQSFVLK